MLPLVLLDVTVPALFTVTPLLVPWMPMAFETATVPPLSTVPVSPRVLSTCGVVTVSPLVTVMLSASAGPVIISAGKATPQRRAADTRNFIRMHSYRNLLLRLTNRPRMRHSEHRIRVLLLTPK